MWNNRLSRADVDGLIQVFDADFRKNFPAVTRWFVTLSKQPNFLAVVGDFELCKVARKYQRENSFLFRGKLHLPSCSIHS